MAAPGIEPRSCRRAVSVFNHLSMSVRGLFFLFPLDTMYRLFVFASMIIYQMTVMYVDPTVCGGGEWLPS